MGPDRFRFGWEWMERTALFLKCYQNNEQYVILPGDYIKKIKDKVKEQSYYNALQNLNKIAVLA